jgi:hypothetical protein
MRVETQETTTTNAQGLRISTKGIFARRGERLNSTGRRLPNGNNAGVVIRIRPESLYSGSDLSQFPKTEDRAQLLPSILLFAVDDCLNLALTKEGSKCILGAKPQRGDIQSGLPIDGEPCLTAMERSANNVLVAPCVLELDLRES